VNRNPRKDFRISLALHPGYGCSVDNYLCDASSLGKRFVIPAPDQSRGQAPAGIQDGEGVSTTESLDSRVRGKDGWGIDISGSSKFKAKHCRYHAASNIVRVSARGLSAICIDFPNPAFFLARKYHSLPCGPDLALGPSKAIMIFCHGKFATAGKLLHSIGDKQLVDKTALVEPAQDLIVDEILDLGVG
jgi:hypothetical protein